MNLLINSISLQQIYLQLRDEAMLSSENKQQKIVGQVISNIKQ